VSAKGATIGRAQRLRPCRLALSNHKRELQLKTLVAFVLGLIIFRSLPAATQSGDTISTQTRPGSPAPPPVGMPQERRVTILVTATDRSGQPLRDLAKDQIFIADNSQTGQVLEVRSADQLPLDLGIVLLASKPDFAQQQTAAIELSRKIQRPGVDHAFVLVAGGDKPWTKSNVEWQSDPATLEKEIKNLDHNAGLADAFAWNFSSANAGMNRRMNLQHYIVGGTGVFNVIWNMMKTDPRPVRRAVVMFRSAWAHAPGYGDTVTQIVDTQHLQVIADAQQLWIPFYIIGVQEPPPPAPAALSQTYSPIQTGGGGYNRVYDQEIEKFRDRAYNLGQVNLERMATETGGRIWWSGKKNYSDAVAGIQNALSSAYAVVYSTPLSAASPQHAVDLRVNNPDFRVFFQKVYYSRQITPPAPGSPSVVSAH
jgi:VWFA-related protein